MVFSFIRGLLLNIAVLLAFSMMYDYLWIKDRDSNTIRRQVLTGMATGVVGIILMITPWIYVPGVIFDTRSILLAISGLFLGFIPTCIAMLIMGIFRLIIGGEGMFMGIAVILTSGLAGIIWGKIKPLLQDRNYILHLLFFGIAVHCMMLLCTFLLPEGKALPTLKVIALPVLSIYPAGTVLLGILLVRIAKNWQAKESLIESEARYQRLHESMTDAFAMVDMEGKIIESNPAFRKMLGYAEQELCSLSFHDITPEKWYEFEEKIIKEQVLANGSSSIYVKEYIRKDGTIFPAEVRTFLLKDRTSKPRAIWAIIRDITDRKRTENDLILAKENAENSNRLKSIFLANISHEIRTPLNAIMGFSSLLNKPDITIPKRQQYTDIIRLSGNRLLQMMDDILDLSKLETKQFSLHLSEFNLYELLFKTIEHFKQSKAAVEKPAITIIANLPENHKDILFHSDINRIQQIVVCLMNNALKFTPKGHIEAGFYITPDNENKATVFVKDTGIGIPEDKHYLIFQRFRQIEENQYHEGAGLGLSIAKGIVELLGGTIWFESQKDMGTTFFFTHPCYRVRRVDITDSEYPQISINLRGTSIIIAEDDIPSFIYLKELLSGENIEILRAENGIELMNLIKSSVPDLILLDISMPVKSGFECLIEMREMGLRSKIIAQTAYASTDEKRKCFELGCHGYIAKPVKKDELLAMIGNVLST